MIDETKKRKTQDSDKDDMYVHFDFDCLDILAGAADDCSFCKWLLYAEWIHRSVTVDENYKHAININAGYEGVIDALAESSIRVDSYLPLPEPANTLSKYYTDNGKADIDHLELVYLIKDLLEIPLFGLWDANKRHLVYRNRYGFSLFTTVSPLFTNENREAVQQTRAGIQHLGWFLRGPSKRR